MKTNQQIIRRLALLALLVAGATRAAATYGASKSIPWDQIGAKAGADYQGDGSAVTPTSGGAQLHCVFQRLDGEATTGGLWLTSTVTNQTSDRFQVKAAQLARAGDARHWLIRAW